MIFDSLTIIFLASTALLKAKPLPENDLNIHLNITDLPPGNVLARVGAPVLRDDQVRSLNVGQNLPVRGGFGVKGGQQAAVQYPRLGGEYPGELGQGSEGVVRYERGNKQTEEDAGYKGTGSQHEGEGRGQHAGIRDSQNIAFPGKIVSFGPQHIETGKNFGPEIIKTEKSFGPQLIENGKSFSPQLVETGKDYNNDYDLSDVRSALAFYQEYMEFKDNKAENKTTAKEKNKDSKTRNTLEDEKLALKKQERDYGTEKKGSPTKVKKPKKGKLKKEAKAEAAPAVDLMKLVRDVEEQKQILNEQQKILNRLLQYSKATNNESL